MKYLLDTMVWLWSVGPTELIGRAGLEILSSGSEEIYLSAASSWEISIKAKPGKFQLPEAPALTCARGWRSKAFAHCRSLRTTRSASTIFLSITVILLIA